MAVGAETQKAALIGKVVAAARRKAGSAAKAKTMEDFVRRFYVHVPPEDIVESTVEDLVGAAFSLWDFMASRKPGAVALRAFNPSAEDCGWNCRHTVIEVVNDDMPFLVDSITTELVRLHLTPQLIIHPVYSLRRTKAGKLHKLIPADGDDPDAIVESVMHIEINELTQPELLRDVERNLKRVLSDVRAAVDDWEAMRVRVMEVIAALDSRPPPAPRAEIEEIAALLRWLDDRNFTFLGYREYAFTGGKRKTTLSVVPKSGLGLLRKDSVSVIEGMEDGAVMPPDVADFLRQPTLLMFSKSNARSTVHRGVHLDTIGIKKFDRAGKVVGERLFVGLFTATVYHQPVAEIPLLRRKVQSVIDRAGFPPVSHNGKALLHILETLPREDMFQLTDDDLFEVSRGILHLQERQRIALFVRRDPFGRYVSCLVFLPRERYTTALREQMQRIVEDGFGGRVTTHYVLVTEAPLARLQLIVKTAPGAPFPMTPEEIEARLISAGRDWRDGLSHALSERYGEGHGLDLFNVYADAFPASYRERFSPHAAVYDIEKMEAARKDDALTLDLYRSHDKAEHELRLKIYHRSKPLPLSDVLPMLENMGLRVVSEIPDRIEPSDEEDPIYIHDFDMTGCSGEAIDLGAVKEIFETSFARLWEGDIEDDGFNALVVAARLDWRDIVVLRAYSKYLRQAPIPFSQTYLEQTLARNPTITRDLVELFHTLFDPASRKGAPARTKRLIGDIRESLNKVSNLDEDRILRRFLNVIQATLRTNFFQPKKDGGPKSYLSFKLDSQAIRDLPLPHPHVEVFVYSPRVEAVHLRGGKVARGGIRWSDRREDFRTEILGLMKAQMTKNAVIVPVGAKGGFVVKQPPAEGGREAMQAEGIECYKIMMRGLLDITDNLTPRKVVHPPHVIRRDGDDPYLVVAADKGTATFSDIANGVAREYGFWLDDAFASGGSAGYDHKKMGITARGAWESVKRHFREIGIDTQNQNFTCIGVGDMSGDVFGNGMLLSRHIRLIGAFNHLHIFIDPDPDPGVSYKERQRLFRLPRSSWSDYDASLISNGGGVFDRKAKAIKITPQMRAALNLETTQDSLAPNELIHAMLLAPVDLLWMGGIGTYVKSADESNAEAGDRINDSLRVDARELRCKVIGEGANLGVTQLGRIEYAQRGGRINTDFIDNSAGVSTSDHEVNIKILMGEVEAAGKISRAQRDKLLADMTDELADHVLLDNYRQSMVLTHAEAQGAARLDVCVRFMRDLERAGKLNRAVEFLPDDEELESRRSAGKGLTRPELAVLLAYAKITLYGDLVTSDLPDDSYLGRGVGLYFPTAIRKRFADYMPKHRLRREISATYVTNSLINRTGPTFVHDLAEKTGSPAGEIARAYLVCRNVFGLQELWAGIEALDNKVAAGTQTTMNLAIQRLVERATVWMIRNGPHPLDVLVAIDRFGAGIKHLSERLDDYLSTELKRAVATSTKCFTDVGVPEALARRIASLDALYPACDIVRIAVDRKHPAGDVAQVYYAIGARFGLDWLRSSAESMSVDTEWQSMAVSAIIDDLYAQQSALAAKVVDEHDVEGWLSANGRGIDRIESMIGEMQRAGTLDLAMLAVANREIRSLST